MRYADNNCEYIETETYYVFRGKCLICDTMISVRVKKEELFEYRKGGLIQNTLKSNNTEEREFLVSGCCNRCFEEVFFLETSIKC